VRALSLGYSPSPNDTHLFHALAHSTIPDAPAFDPILRDIETLNQLAVNQELDVVKVSFHALGFVIKQYGLLHSGGAMGRGCGPLLVARDQVRPAELRGMEIAIPGRLTSAALMAQLFDPALGNLAVLPYHEIMPAVQQGKVGAGVIIHESRLTFPEYGLKMVVDLGGWWEKATGHPIPLAGIAVRRDLDRAMIQRVESAVRASVAKARTDRPQTLGYVRQLAPEMSEEVIEAQIDLYVNDYTSNYGADGEAAIRQMLDRAVAAGIVDRFDRPLFALDEDRS
jgi:1,4-dihydroxy-6-naphthoate synthase